MSIHVDDTGTRITGTCKENGAAINIALATVMLLAFERKDKTVFVRTAQLVTSGSDGKLYYDSVLGDFTVPGTSKVQAFLGFTSGSWHSDIVEFEVEKNID